MVKVINLDNMPIMQNVYQEFSTIDEANKYLMNLAEKFAHSGYEVEHIPATEGILFNDPQMLKVTKVFNVINPNATDNIIVFALVPHAEGELITITRNRMKYYGEAEDETNYNFVNKNMSLNELHAEMLQNNYKPTKHENGIFLYKSETDTFVSEVYVM